MSLLDKLWTSDKPASEPDPKSTQPTKPAQPPSAPPVVVPARRPAWPMPQPTTSDQVNIPPSPTQTLGGQLLGNIASEGAGDFLQLLRDRTNFDSTSIGQKVAHEMKPLEALGSAVTEAQKIQVVLKSGAEDGLTGESIIQAYDKLLAQLDDEKKGFDSIIMQARMNQVSSPNKLIADKTAQIQQLQQQLLELTQQVSSAQVKIQSNESQFGAAYDQRKLELTQARAHYQKILEGISK